jgi:hypothetical protein
MQYVLLFFQETHFMTDIRHKTVQAWNERGKEIIQSCIRY